MLHDRYGNEASTTSRAALEKFDQALELIRLYRGDPIAALDAALEHDSDFGGAWAVRAGLLCLQTDKAYEDEIARSLRAGLSANLNDRERAHLAAAQTWADGRMHDAGTGFAAIAQAHPRDLIAVQNAHLTAFFLGRQQDLRDWPVQALRAFAPGDDGYHALVGMAAFGFEECGDFARAEDLGREAVEFEPRDGWAVHAVAHVHEMRGDRTRGMAWLTDSAESWAPESGFAYHNWWHLALLHMDSGDHAGALKLYDEKVRPDDATPIVLEWVDASALLWRLHLEGVDIGDRFAKLAASWERAAEDAIYSFNDVHAIMAFIGAGRHGDVARTLKAMRAAAAREDDNGAITRAIGLPLAEAFAAFDAGQYGVCAEKIASVRGVAQRFGGSHAQRDILTLTALHAALRGGAKGLAEALSFERTMQKPESPWARGLAKRARAMQAPRVAA